MFAGETRFNFQNPMVFGVQLALSISPGFWIFFEAPHLCRSLNRWYGNQQVKAETEVAPEAEATGWPRVTWPVTGGEAKWWRRFNHKNGQKVYRWYCMIYNDIYIHGSIHLFIVWLIHIFLVDRSTGEVVVAEKCIYLKWAMTDPPQISSTPLKR